MTILATPTLYLVWALMIVGEAVLVAIIFAKGRRRKFPVFSGYAVLVFVKSLTLLYVSLHDELGAYFYAYFLAGIVEWIVSFAVITEVFVKVFAPKRLLTRGLMSRIVTIYAIVLLTSVALSLINIQEHPIAIMRFARFIERASTLCLFFSFAFLCGLSKVLRISWRKHCFGIGVGFVVMLSISAVYHALVAWSWPGSFQQLRYISMASSILAQIIWASYFWRNEPELVPVSEQTLEELATFLKDIQRGLERKDLAKGYSQDC